MAETVNTKIRKSLRTLIHRKHLAFNSVNTPMSRPRPSVPALAGQQLGALDLPLATIAHTVGCSRMCVSHYIHGQRVPGPHTQIAIETLLGVGREGWTLAPNGSPLKAPAASGPSAPFEPAEGDDTELRAHLEARGIDPDASDELTDVDCDRLDAELRATLARRGLTLPCEPAEVMAAWARDPWPSATDFEVSLPAQATPPTVDVDEPKPAGAGPLHIFQVRAVHREVAKYGRAVAIERMRTRGLSQWIIDEALSMPAPAPRDE